MILAAIIIRGVSMVTRKEDNDDERHVRVDAIVERQHVMRAEAAKAVTLARRADTRAANAKLRAEDAPPDSHPASKHSKRAADKK